MGHRFMESLFREYKEEIWTEAFDLLEKQQVTSEFRRNSQACVQVTAFLALTYWYQDIEDWEDALAFANQHITYAPARKTIEQVADIYGQTIKEFTTRNYKRKELRATAILGSFSFHRGRHPFWSRYPRGFFSSLIMALLKLKSEDKTILDISSENEGLFLDMLLNPTIEHIDIMTTSFTQQAILAIQQVLLEDQLTLLDQSSLQLSDNKKQYTKIYGLNRFSHMVRYRAMRDGDEAENSLGEMVELYQDWAAVQSAIVHLSDDGRAVIAVNSSAVLNQSNQDIRERLIRSGRIEAVMVLPPMLQRTSQPMYLVVISKDNTKVRLIDGTDFGDTKQRLYAYEKSCVNGLIEQFLEGGKNVRDVSMAELEKQEFCLDPVRYIGMEQLAIDDATILDKLANIGRGAFARAKVLDELITEEPTDIKYLTIRDLTTDNDLASLRSLPEEFNQFCLNEGDIVMSRVAPFRIRLVHRKPETKIVANGNLYIIRPKMDIINTTYLYMTLCSELGQKQLEMLAKGGGMRAISLRDLKSIKIPVIPRAAQDAKALQYLELKDQLDNLRQQCRDMEAKMTKLINDNTK